MWLLDKGVGIIVSLITQVLIPAVLIPIHLKKMNDKQNFKLGIKTSLVGMGWILILGLGHIKPRFFELAPLVLIPA